MVSRRSLALAALLAAAPACTALLSPHRLARGRQQRVWAAPTPVQMIAVPRALNPFDWTVDRPNRSKRVVGAEHYRLLGVHPDAPHAEISEKKELLINTRYPGDVKKKIKLEIAYDEIMRLRFEAAASGNLVKEEGAEMVSQIERAEEEAAEAAAKKGGLFDFSDSEEDNEGIFVTKPIDMRRVKVTIPTFFGMSLFSMLWIEALPPVVLVIKGLMHLISVNMIYMRDRPIANEGRGENIFSVNSGSMDGNELTKAMTILLAFNLGCMFISWVLRVIGLLPSGISVGMWTQAIANSAAVILTRVYGVSK